MKPRRSWASSTCASASSSRLAAVLLRLQGLVEARPGGEALRHQLLLALEGVARRVDLAPRGVEGGLRGAERVLLGLRVEPGDDLAGRDAVADIDRPLGDAPADAERQRDVLLGLDLAATAGCRWRACSPRRRRRWTGRAGVRRLRFSLDRRRPDRTER